MKYKLILASNSPRRQQLLRELGLNYDIKTKIVDEVFPEDMPASEVAEYLAKKKGSAYQSDLSDNELVITADTTVVTGTTILNKPADEEEAKYMLELLSGKSHQVITGVCLTTQQSQISFRDTTTVFFRTLTEKEIEYYIRQYQPFDKAGGYAIQEWIGMTGIVKIEGSYFNVVGLPVEKLYKFLRDMMDINPLADFLPAK